MSRAAQGEMTTREAVAYLSEWTDYPVSTKLIYLLRSAGVPLPAEKRGSRLVFRKSGLDAFLAEYGSNPEMWHSGFARDRIGVLHEQGIYDPAVEAIYRALDPDPDAMRPSDFA